MVKSKIGIVPLEEKPEVPVKKLTSSSKTIPHRYDNFIGKYDINLEEKAQLESLQKSGAIYICYNDFTKNYDILDKTKHRYTAMSKSVFPNIPKDGIYSIIDILEKKPRKANGAI